MRRLTCLLLTALFILIGNLSLAADPSAAQSDTVWYWATTPEGLVAYTADGQTNVIYAAPDLYGNDYFAARLDHDTALVRGGGAFYLVTAETAQNLPIPPSAVRLRPYSYRHPYIVLMETETILPAAVLNVETFEVVALAGQLLNPPRFLPDGVTLRYVGLELAEGQVVSSTLFEQNLVTGELIKLLKLANDGMVISSGDGMYWWVEDENGELQTIGDPDPRFTKWLRSGEAEVHGDWLWQRDPNCSENCTFISHSLVDDTIYTLSLPALMFDFPDKISLFPDGSIAFIGTTDVRRLWLQNPDGTLLELGEIDYMQITGEYISEDGQWAIAMGHTANGEATARLWDLPKREVVFEAPYPESYSYHLFAGDTVGIYHSGRSQILYWNGEATPLNLYANSLFQYPDNFFDIFPGGHAFYEHPDGGISRFDAATESMTLLVPGGKHISVYDLR